MGRSGRSHWYSSCMLQVHRKAGVEVPEEQKQKMENTMLELVKICQAKEFLCMHDNVDDLIESALDSKLLSINSINSQRLDKKEQEVRIAEEQPAERRNLQPILSTREPENSLIYNDDFEDIEYVEASLLDPKIVSIEKENGVEEANVVQREEKEVEDISQVQDVVLREKHL
nr:hypothetical protein [Tanacetum cinerariifolium]